MTLQKRQASITEIENGLNFILLHFNQDKLFPRTITTGKLEGRQIEIFSKQEALSYFKESNLLDSKINAFPSYTEYKGIQRYPPDFIFIDIDRSNFKDDKSFENALSKTMRNIKEELNGGYPTVNNSGNGFHIIQPIECPIILEQVEQFQKYKDKFPLLSQEFLRFAEDFLSNGKADPGHHPSFKSCQIRVPGSINGKCLDDRDRRLLSDNFKVKILQKWNGVRPSIPRKFIEDFRTHLEQKITDHENNNYKYKKYNQQNRYFNRSSSSEWIEKILLQTPVQDGRKKIVVLILAPYLILVKKLSYEESFQIINKWLQKCDLLSGRKLDFNTRSFISTAFATAYKKQIPPMSITTLKTNYKNLYFLLVQKGERREGD